MYRKLFLTNCLSKNVFFFFFFFLLYVRLISSMAHYNLEMFGCIAIISSALRHDNGYLLTYDLFGYCHCLEQNRFFTYRFWRHHTDNLSVAKGLKLPAVSECLYLCYWKRIWLQNVLSLIIWYYVAFKFWATLKLFRRYVNPKPKRFDFGIEYKSTDRYSMIGKKWSSEKKNKKKKNKKKTDIAFLKIWVYIQQV